MSGSDHYAPERARGYQDHHAKNIRTRLTTWRERRCLYQALRDAGSPRSALDLPCGTGRFWPAFAAAGVERLIAADGSAGMLDVARANRLSSSYPEQLFVTSAFDAALPDGCVDFVACLRFYHHLSMPEDRRRLLAEVGRLTTRFAAVSLWVDGNLAGRRRLQKPLPEPVSGYGRRICRRRSEVEAEFAAAGFRTLRHYDVWPRLSMWRLYLLEHDDR